MKRQKNPKYKIVSNEERIRRLKESIRKFKKLKEYDFVVKNYKNQLKELEEINNKTQLKGGNNKNGRKPKQD